MPIAGAKEEGVEVLVEEFALCPEADKAVGKDDSSLDVLPTLAVDDPKVLLAPIALPEVCRVVTFEETWEFSVTEPDPVELGTMPAPDPIEDLRFVRPRTRGLAVVVGGLEERPFPLLPGMESKKVGNTL